MSISVTLKTITSGYNANAINDNFVEIQQALADALSRSGSTPNMMEADLDMNSKSLLNAASVDTQVLRVNGETVQVGDPVTPTDAILIQGTTSPIADISWDGNKLTDLGDATADTDALNRQTGDGRYLQASNDLSDVADVPTAQTNLLLLPGTNVQAQDDALQNIADTTWAAGDILYVDGSGDIVRLPAGTEGQALSMESGFPNWVDNAGSGYTFGTPFISETGVTALDFTGLPAGVEEVILSLNEASLSGTDDFLIQLGTASSWVTTGYTAGSFNTGAAASSTSGFIIGMSLATRAFTGTLSLIPMDSARREWFISFTGPQTNNVIAGGGHILLTEDLSRIRLTRTGSNTFDADAFRIKYK